MRIHFIRWLDTRIGIPLCALLTFQRRIKNIFKQPDTTALKTNPRTLFIKLSEQGSTVVAIPAIQRATELTGKDNLYFLTFKENRPILDLVAVIPPANIIEIDTRTIWVLIRSLLAAAIRIRREQIDACLDMEFFSRASAILAYLSKAPARVGLHCFNHEGPYRGDLFTHRLLYNPYLHAKTFFLSEVEALTVTPPERGPLSFETPTPQEPLHFSPSANQMRALIDKIQKLKNGELAKPVVVLNPNASDLLPLRKWPEENFIDLGKKIVQDFPCATIVVSGTLKEKERADVIAANIPGALSLAGHTTLGELLTLYSVADILVTNDSGPAHFSCLTPIKAIILFGPETPRLWGPEGEGKICIASTLACSPCMNAYNQRQSACTNALCLKNITTHDVYEKVKNALRGDNTSCD